MSEEASHEVPRITMYPFAYQFMAHDVNRIPRALVSRNPKAATPATLMGSVPLTQSLKQLNKRPFLFRVTTSNRRTVNISLL